MLRGPRNGVKAPGGTGAFIVTFGPRVSPAYPRYRRRVKTRARARGTHRGLSSVESQSWRGIRAVALGGEAHGDAAKNHARMLWEQGVGGSNPSAPTS